MNPFILVVIGFILIFIEFFVPGSLMGIAGGLLVVLSVIFFAMQDHSGLEVALFIIAVSVSLGFLIYFTLKRIPKTKPGRSIYLGTDQEGYFASEFDKALVDKTGKVSADLKPSGFIIIEGKQYQAMSQGDYIVKGTEIVVIGGRGAFLIVKIKQ